MTGHTLTSRRYHRRVISSVWSRQCRRFVMWVFKVRTLFHTLLTNFVFVGFRSCNGKVRISHSWGFFFLKRTGQGPNFTRAFDYKDIQHPPWVVQHNQSLLLVSHSYGLRQILEIESEGVREGHPEAPTRRSRRSKFLHKLAASHPYTNESSMRPLHSRTMNSIHVHPRQCPRLLSLRKL